MNTLGNWCLSGVQTIFNNWQISPLKDEIYHNKKSNLVYEVSCKNCAFVYIGQTKRDLKSRITEH